ncbi:MAG TPA: RdgB/HAM1 family non-canonical purine NTP pyrophosphatase [Deltaproteobacteria bacterium]|nr:RdgB/HAM1 family non-canonical purine NTP pyrophosphatase [Deltaproteobacteria bacterium]
MARIVVASGNAGKRREIARILTGFEIVSLGDFPGIVFPEEGGDYFENARTKALVAARETGLPCVADDSGLEVDALGGAPGPFSARFGGAGLDDRERIEALLAALRERAAPRTARFFCVAACALPDGHVEVTEGSCPGRILESPEGSGGFGYDPIFRPDGFDRPMAGLTREEKDAISHRGQAFRRLEPVIRRLVRRTDG